MRILCAKSPSYVLKTDHKVPRTEEILRISEDDTESSEIDSQDVLRIVLCWRGGVHLLGKVKELSSLKAEGKSLVF